MATINFPIKTVRKRSGNNRLLCQGEGKDLLGKNSGAEIYKFCRSVISSVHGEVVFCEGMGWISKMWLTIAPAIRYRGFDVGEM
jgi:hypothetical protein